MSHFFVPSCGALAAILVLNTAALAQTPAPAPSAPSPHAVVLDEFPETAILTLAHRTVEAHRVPSHAQHPPRLVQRQVGGAGRFLCCRLSPQFLQ